MFSHGSLISRFARDDRGSIAIMFGLTSISLVIAVGLATDMGIALHARTRLAQAIDSAALSAAKASREHNLDAGKTEALARSYVDAIVKDMSDVLSTLRTPEVKVDTESSTIEIKLKADYRTRFGGLVSVLQIPIEVEGSARIDGNDIEVSMSLDVTGSMAESQSGSTKIAALKSAATLAVTTLIPAQPGAQKVRIGLAPYAAGVNAGAVASAVNGSSSDACAYERMDLALQPTDVSPNGSNRLKGRNDLSGEGACPTSANAVVPLTDSISTLTTAINGLTTNGVTAGHLGAAWSWYLLSPDWNSVWSGNSQPVAYNDGKTIKAAIQMTDGKFNAVGGKSGNDAQSNSYAISTCAAMKAKNITVYTIGFGDGVTGSALTTLQSCASDINKFYLATNQTELEAAFKSIAKDITSLRLTK